VTGECYPCASSLARTPLANFSQRRLQELFGPPVIQRAPRRPNPGSQRAGRASARAGSGSPAPTRSIKRVTTVLADHSLVDWTRARSRRPRPEAIALITSALGAARGRVRLVRRGLVVPDYAVRMAKQHWFVELFVQWALLVFANRASLKKPVRDLNGHVLVTAMPEWHVDPYPGERTKALAKRRADWIERRLQVILIVVAHMSFKTKVVLSDPSATDFMMLKQIGRELPNLKCQDPVDAVEPAMRFLVSIGFFSKVLQHRQKLTEGPNAGKFRSYGAALRRVSSEWMAAAEGMIAGGWKRLQNYSKRRRRKRPKNARRLTTYSPTRSRASPSRSWCLRARRPSPSPSPISILTGCSSSRSSETTATGSSKTTS
jgi:hypothetical protein